MTNQSQPLPWFRLYHEMLDDDKLRLLAFEDRWHYVAILCCKAKGILDADEEWSLLQRRVSVRLGVQVRELEEICRRLMEIGLIDDSMQPSSWNKRQCRSDSDSGAAERMRARRERVKYGWDELLKRQDKKCACCGSLFETPYSRYVVHDHNHETLEYRGLLCQSCNKLVGQYENGETMVSDVRRDMCHEYLSKWDSTHVSDVTLRNVTVTEGEGEGEKDTTTPVRSTRTDSRFDEFWQAWPAQRKRDKKKARDVWKRKKLDRLADTIITDVRNRQAKDNQWLRGFVPMPTTYLNGERWEDVIESPSDDDEGNDPFAGAL